MKIEALPPSVLKRALDEFRKPTPKKPKEAASPPTREDLTCHIESPWGLSLGPHKDST